VFRARVGVEEPTETLARVRCGGFGRAVQ
jgi:hypothetical protein